MFAHLATECGVSSIVRTVFFVKVIFIGFLYPPPTFPRAVHLRLTHSFSTRLDLSAIDVSFSGARVIVLITAVIIMFVRRSRDCHDRLVVDTTYGHLTEPRSVAIVVSTNGLLLTSAILVTKTIETRVN